MSKTPNYDSKIKEILDELEPGERTCEMTGEKWMMDEEEIGWYRKFNVPPSRRSPLTAQKIMSSFYATYQWWWHKNADTGKPVMTYIHPATGIQILPDEVWFSKDFSEINADYKIDEPFFDQLRELQLKVPVNHTRNMKEPSNSVTRASFGDVNSLFTSGCRSKNTFFANDSLDVENSAEIQTANKISDSFNILHSQRIHNCKFVRESFDCINCSFIFDCRNCESCFGAWNKRNKKYLWFNEQLSKEEWEKRVAEVDLGSRKVLEEYKKKFYEEIIQDKAVWPENFNVNVEDCTGEYLLRSTNLRNCWMAEDSKNNYWTTIVFEQSEGNAWCGALIAQNQYKCTVCMYGAGNKFCFFCTRCDDLEYSINCYECTHCFGCVGLRNKKFHIFNKPYEEEDYWKRVDELKSAMLDRGEYGSFLPLSMSPSYFPEAGAVVYIGADPSEGEALGALEFDPRSLGAYGEDLIDPSNVKEPDDVPDHINDVDSEVWCKVPINDPVQNRRFSYWEPEIKFYKKMGLAASNQHFIRRVYELYYQINTAKPIDVKCGKCETDVRTSFNHFFKKRNIYCKKCYQEYLEQYG